MTESELLTGSSVISLYAHRCAVFTAQKWEYERQWVERLNCVLRLSEKTIIGYQEPTAPSVYYQGLWFRTAEEIKPVVRVR